MAMKCVLERLSRRYER